MNSESFEWMQPVSKEIFENKYCINGEQNEVEVFQKVAEEIARPETTAAKRKEYKEKFFDLLSSRKFIPGGRILANARPEARLRNYNNCFTIDIEDDLAGIYDSLKEDALISKSGGGVGFDVSKLRPKHDGLSIGGIASGPISFMRVFNESAKIIQTGGARRSAHIALMDVSHPDIEEFITVKQGEGNSELTQFNISVKVTDAFMEAVEKDEDWDLVWEDKVYKTVKATYLWNLLAKNAYTHNEPGIFNVDHVNKYNNGYWAFDIHTVNPCGEICMPYYSLCCLGSLNLVNFVHEEFNDMAWIDWDSMRETIRLAVRFLDNVLDATDYPLQKIMDVSKQWRRVGLGFTGLGDLFAMMKVKYGSEESKVIADKIGRFMRDEAYTASVELAKEKGSFPGIDNEKLVKSQFIQEMDKEMISNIKKNGLRNIGLLTCAPTGTTSLSVGQNCSSGIEPIFSLQYNRNIRTGRGDETVTETVYDYAWLKYQEYIKTLPQEEQDEIVYVNDIPEAPDYFATTMEIETIDGIDIQAIFQKYIDHSISKTANLKPGTTFKEYEALFTYAYKQGLKGFTSFNPEGSMKGILEYNEPKKDEESLYVVRRTAPERPQDLECDIHRIKVKEGEFTVLVGTLNGSLYEVFVDDNHVDIHKHKKGMIRKNGRGQYDLFLDGEKVIKNLSKAFNKTFGTLARLISMALRHGTPLQFVVDQLSKSEEFVSFDKAMSRVLKKYIKDGEKVMTGDTCPECGSELIYKDGCVSCGDCFWSKCS